MIFFLLITFFIISVILPIINFIHTISLSSENSKLRKMIENIQVLKKNTKFENEAIQTKKELVVEPKNDEYNKNNQILTVTKEEKKGQQNPIIKTIENKKEISSPPTKENSKQLNLEKQLGTRFSIWLGSASLILSVVFLFRYSIVNGLLTFPVRVSLGAISGVIFISVGQLIYAKKSIANRERIGQAFTGSGICILYLIFYVSSDTLISYEIAFIAMIATTLASLYFAIQQGYPIAIIGLLGGYTTPILISTNLNSLPIGLFIYFYFLFLSFIILIKKKQLWGLILPSSIGILLWVLIWINTSFLPANIPYIFTFLLLVNITLISFSNIILENDKHPYYEKIKISNYISLGVSIFFLVIMTNKASFQLSQWVMFAIINAALLFLAYKKEKVFKPFPFVSLIINISLLLMWNTSFKSFYTTLIIFATLHIVPSLLLMSQKKILSPLWSSLYGVSILNYFVLAFFKYHQYTYHKTTWSLISLACFIFMVFIIKKIYQKHNSSIYYYNILLFFSFIATFFLTFSLMIKFNSIHFTSIIAAEILILAYINAKVDIKKLHSICITLIILFFIIIIPEIKILTLDIIKIFTEFHSMSFINPLNQLAIPIICFTLANKFFRKKQLTNLINFFDILIASLSITMIYYLNQNFFHLPLDNLCRYSSFLERGVMTNIFLLGALLSTAIFTHLNRKTVLYISQTLLYLAISRIIYFDFIKYNPLLSTQDVGNIVIFNFLIIIYILPIIWIFFILKISPKDYYRKHLKYLMSFSFILLFSYISLNIRLFFSGGVLNSRTYNNNEIYTYSIVWLMLGISLLIAGFRTNKKEFRFASIIVLFITIIKVFLIDASQLQGLWRVFSFLGLGLSFIGLGYLYGQFFSKIRETKNNN